MGRAGALASEASHPKRARAHMCARMRKEKSPASPVKSGECRRFLLKSRCGITVPHLLGC